MSRDGALHLLLIIDYIFDWARDIYRIAILRLLQSLSGPDLDDNITIGADTDIASMRHHPVMKSLQTQSSHETDNMDLNASPEPSQEEKPPLRELDSPYGSFRHASMIESECLGLFITRDNMNTLFQSFDNNELRRTFAREVLQTLSDGMLLRGSVLDELEDIWTGELRRHTNPQLREQTFSVRLAFNTWLTQDWDQVRQLSYIAVAEDAIDTLMERSKFKRYPRSALPCQANSVLDLCRRLKSTSMSFNLMAAISWAALSFDNWMTEDLRQSIYLTQRKCMKINRLGAYRLGSRGRSKMIEDDRQDKTHRLVQKTYEQNKVGDLEPPWDFIRRSTRSDTQTLEADTAVKPFTQSQNLCSTKEGFVLLVAGCSQKSSPGPGSPQLCLFKVSGPPELPRETVLMKSLEVILLSDSDIYSTTRIPAKKSRARQTGTLASLA